MIPVIVIEGPTASGKSQLAFELALALETEIVSADSRQVYKYLDIGTAKPSPNQQETVKHWLLDIISPKETYTAGRFRKDSTQIISQLAQNSKIPIIAGGTGLYIRSLLEGLADLPEIDPLIRRQLEEECQSKGLQQLYVKLKAVDDKIAGDISPQDKQRILRALEVYRSTGIPLSKHWQQQKTDVSFHVFRILLTDNREVLYQRINQRVLQMIETGLLTELEGIMQKGYTWDDPGLKTLGYQEFRSYFESQENLDDCIKLVQQKTRNYAKRQLTWYRKISYTFTASYAQINTRELIHQINAHFGVQN